MGIRPSYTQIEGLIEFLEQNPGIAKGILRTSQAKQVTKRKWETLAPTLNAMGGAIKTGKGWAKWWAEKKCTLKKTCVQHVNKIKSNDTDLAEALTISALELRMVAVMGGLEYAAGDSSQGMEILKPTEESSQHDTSVVYSDVVMEKTEPREEASNPVSEAESISVSQASSPPLSNYRATRRSARIRKAKADRERPELSWRNWLDAETDRLTAIEERRIQAEQVTAHALAEAITRLDKCAAAIEGLASAHREGTRQIADALLAIAKKLS